MYIYHKQCEKQCKKSMKQLKRSESCCFSDSVQCKLHKDKDPTLKPGKQCFSFIKRRLKVSRFLAFQSKVNLCFLQSRKPNTRSSRGVSIWLWLLLQVSICPPLQSRQEHKFGQILILGDPKTFSWNIPRFRLHSCTTAQTLKACRRSVSAANS